MGESYLKILSVSQLFMCLEAVGGGMFRGTGNTLPPSASSIFSNVLRVPLVYVLVHFTPLGLNGVWWGVSISGCLRGGLIYIWYAIVRKRQPREDLLSKGEVDDLTKAIRI